MGAAMRRIHVGNALSAFGLGFTVPYLYVYVAQVRGLGSVTAGLVLAVFAVAALIVLPFAGRAIVRRGPLPVLLVALVTAALGALSLGLSASAGTVLLSAAALGAGQAVMQPALATMIVDCSTTETRSRAFAMQFFLQNLGLGVGGLIGGHLVDTTSPSSFTLLFAIEAAMFLVLVAVMATVRTPRAPRIEGALGQAGGGSWKQLLGNRAMVQLCVLGFVLFFACYGQFESGLSAYGVEAAGISTSALGTALAANTLVIVIAQFAVLKFVERRKRSRVIASVGLIWAVAWAVAGYAGLGHGSQTMATAAFISTYALFGLGEAMLSPTLAPLVADLAPTGLAGQYNSAFALVKQLALAIGPAVGGPLGASLHAPYIVAFLLFSLGITVLAVRLGRQLTDVQNQPSLARSRVVTQGGAPADAVVSAEA
ncbi:MULTISPECIES: MDR family MFS transporter [Streptomyces]|uniref:Integral membrane protein n=1 Tax=Streptomyces coelicolor (strain ATCC BAA-471 / A3(2) / M145) TaxID=100226 RepID=Q9KYE9_STRCO|nr:MULTISPECIES: MFS transporter [Streptomyces]MDX2929029.1 MFS transporter [Streptomyces sp. NRRL_B-16638]MDX3400890.1 MFS transporter [Streptomyces sp. ME01-18h]MDX3411976.1 MFS transporter [Streptomyces sp. ME02-6977A]MYU43642.1 MFS transporter [Streptomyces sp. SID7813]NSL84558.1 MFS transporter [Streptomyces coelicolor]